MNTRVPYGIAFAFAAASAMAADVPKEGSYDFVSCWSGVNNPIAFSKTHTASAIEFSGTTRSATPGALFDNNTFHCVGLVTVINGKASNTIVCESVDPEGDRRLRQYSMANGKTSVTDLAGTGKYDGIVTIDQVQPLGPFPTIKPGTFQNCNHQFGTYKIKSG